MVNTNGKRIANDDAFLEQLAEVGPSFYFQFDGFRGRDCRDGIEGEEGVFEENSILANVKRWNGFARKAGLELESVQMVNGK